MLHNHRKADEKNSNGFVLGSLRSDLSKDFNGRFDMVVGNPPWSRLRGNKEETDKLNATFTKLTRQSLTDRGFHDIAKTYIDRIETENVMVVLLPWHCQGASF